MNTSRLDILLVCSEDTLMHEISQKIRARFEKLEIHIDVFDDGKRAANEFKNKRHHIVIATEHLPGLSGTQLSEEVRKIDGSTSIFILGEANAGVGIEQIALPIVNWTEFLNRVQLALPDEIKSKYGLVERNNRLYEQLVEYGQKYKVASKESTTSPILCIPRFFEDDGTSNSKMGPSSSTTGATIKTIFKALDPTARAKNLKIELVILGLLTCVTMIMLYIYRDSPLGWISIPGCLVGLTSFSFAGFFVGHAFDRFLFSKDV